MLFEYYPTLLYVSCQGWPSMQVGGMIVTEKLHLISLGKGNVVFWVHNVLIYFFQRMQ